MRFQFSLATLLVCITVLAAVCTCVKLPVGKPHHFTIKGEPIHLLTDTGESADRPPTATEIAERLAVWGSASVTATLGMLWIGRRVMCPRPPLCKADRV